VTLEIYCLIETTENWLLNQLFFLLSPSVSF